jgi:hypothetical protein
VELASLVLEVVHHPRADAGGAKLREDEDIVGFKELTAPELHADPVAGDAHHAIIVERGDAAVAVRNHCLKPAAQFRGSQLGIVLLDERKNRGQLFYAQFADREIGCSGGHGSSGKVESKSTVRASFASR